MTTWSNQSKFSGQIGVAFDSAYTFDDIYLEFDGTLRTVWSSQAMNSSAWSQQSKTISTSWSNQIKN